jgi:flagellin
MGASLGIISSYNRDSAGNVTTGMIDIPLKNVRLIDANGTAKAGILDSATGTVSTKALLDMSVSNLTGISGTTDADKFDKLLTDVEKVLGKMASAASELGAAKSRVDMQKDFVSKLSDSIDRGVGQLVDADMDRESTRLQALQVQQQLGIQALSIANSSAQNILSLFKS